MLVIRQGHVVDPGTGMDGIFDVEIADGKIARIGTDLEGDYEQELPAAGMIVAPGLIDGHVHFRDPGFTYKEDIQTGAKAAAKGGFTTVICMANTRPVVDNVETLSDILERGRETDIHVLQAAAVTKGLKGQELTDMEALLKAGATGFTDDGIPLMDEAVAVRAMEKAKELDVVLSFHEEDASLIANNGINRGKISEQLGIGGSPSAAEDSLVERDCKLALQTGAKVNIQHISSGKAVDLVRQAKKAGARVYAEATPHHFTLNEEAVLQYGALAKMNPPLRTEDDRLEIIRGLQDGAIDMIATDHAPHSAEEKAKPLTEAPSGIIGLETSLALGITSLVRPGHLTLMELMQKMSKAPAEIYGLPGGTLETGAPADLVIFQEDAVWSADHFCSKSWNSPFYQQSLYGKVICTICGGRIVYRDSSWA